MMRPPLGSMSRLIIFRVVVLPHPDGPTSIVSCPVWNSIVRSPTPSCAPDRLLTPSVPGILYTIPSLALFAILIPFTGLTLWTAEIGLVGYTLLILIRNIVVGLDSVPAEIREAARGMGFRPLPQLWQIDIPLALPAIMAG